MEKKVEVEFLLIIPVWIGRNDNYALKYKMQILLKGILRQLEHSQMTETKFRAVENSRRTKL